MEQLSQGRRPARHQPSHARNSGLPRLRTAVCLAVIAAVLLGVGIGGQGGPAGVVAARAAVPHPQRLPLAVGELGASSASSAVSTGSVAPALGVGSSSAALDRGRAKTLDTFPASALAADGIPVTALRAYTQAAWHEARVSPQCNLSWLLLAGIGRVESDHGRFAGAVLHSDGLSTPPVVGIPLNGNGTALIRDTDHGALDGDTVYDRAVGPMQFIPSTWAGWGVDANGDGIKDPFNIFDAAAAAADYLCAAGGDLSTTNGQIRAILSYNWSWDYVRLVMSVELAYANGAVGITVPVLPTTPDPGGGHPTLPPVDPGKPRGLPSGTTSSPPSTSPAPGPTSKHNPAPSTSSSQPGSSGGSSSSSSSPSSSPGGSSSSSSSSSSAPAPSSSDPQPCTSASTDSSSTPDPSCPSPSDSSSVSSAASTDALSAAAASSDASSAASTSGDSSSSGP